MKPIQFIAIKTVWVETEWASKIGHFKYRTEKNTDQWERKREEMIIMSSKMQNEAVARKKNSITL